jgi:hypothetical protein
VPASTSGKGRVSADEAFGVGEGVMDSGARREGELLLLHSRLISNFFISFFGGGAALSGILILILGPTLGRNFVVKIGKAA